MPENVGPVRWFNPIVGTCLLVLASVTALPVSAALYFDGVASISDWPAMFNWLSAFAAIFFAAAIYLLVTPQRVGAGINFRKDGFSLCFRHLILKDQDHEVDWVNVEKIELVQASRQPDGLKLTLTRGAPISFRTVYFEIGGEEILARLSVSAEAAKYRLERTNGFNALMIEKQTWRVFPNS